MTYTVGNDKFQNAVEVGVTSVTNVTIYYIQKSLLERHPGDSLGVNQCHKPRMSFLSFNPVQSMRVSPPKTSISHF